MILTSEQKNVIRNIIKDVNSGAYQTITFGGHAGCGKTTCIGYLSNYFKNFVIAAYTGKATNVLRKKGLQSTTIHSAIYNTYKDEHGNVKWSITNKNEILNRGIEGFLIDEASMVSRDIHEDLISFGLPVIYIGDHGQLESIGTKINLMQDPMHRLETVHRNAGEIAHFAEHIRKGKPPSDFKASKQVQLVKESLVQDRHLASVDQVICAYNRTRVKLNERVRKEKKINFAYIGKGEKIICLRNKRSEGLFNGMQGVVQKIHNNDRFDFISDGEYYENIKYDIDQFGKEANDFDFSQEPNPFDYAYAITAHKAQGDEFGSVIAYEERCNKWDHIRWAYTVASRAKKSLIWIPHETYLPNYLK